MSNALYLLLSHPDKYRTLQKEIDAAYNAHQIPDLDVESDDVESYHDVLAGLKYLNAVMYVFRESKSTRL
jgi:cytochrome P450